MTRRVLVLVALCAAVLVPLAAVPAGAVGDCTPQSSWGTLDRTFAQQVLTLVNQHRAARGLAQLQSSPSLTAAAEWKSLHMAGYGYFAHNDPAPPVARSVGERLAACGYPASSSGWGENIAYGYTTPQSVMDGWLNSQGHRANIENSTFRALGVGVARDAAGRLYWTQDFGTSTAGTTPPPSPPPAPGGDTQAPTTPTGLATTSVEQSRIALRWTASGDNVGVTAYGLYVNGSRIGSVSGTSAAVTGFSCGTRYTLGVDAVDAAGNRSSQATLSVTTAACSTPAPPPSTDTQAPTRPSALAVASTTRTSIGLRWSPSTDNVGVTGYRVYRSSTLVATVTGTTATVGGLSCGRWYSLTVRATDAAGNLSSGATLYARTAAC
jgi:uncharacterized protein YkwD/chitodextrinase